MGKYMRYWLLKSEPDELSIDDVENDKLRVVPWTGVRNFQARNFIREMQVGDLAFFYHSSCADIGIAGIVEVISESYPDPTQFDEKSQYYDPRATAENPRWLTVDVRYFRKTKFIPLSSLREYPELESMRVLSKGSRLSVTPVEPSEWVFIEKLI
jgi:predicted RNA-binding protein with PUA-like domain